MPADVINVFSRTHDPAGVAGLLRRLHPSVAIEGPDHDWRKATLTFGRLWMKRRLTFTYDPEYHAEPNWSTQMDGMRGYFQRFPESLRKAAAVALPTTFRYALAAIVDPELADGPDPRFDVISAVARHLDGVLFLPSALLDAEGRVLFGAGGEATEDPGAVWPRVVATVRVPGGGERGETEDDEDDDEPDPPTPGRVARRALALVAVTVRAHNEAEAHGTEADGLHRELLDWVRDVGIEDELEGPNPSRPGWTDERGIVACPPGELEAQAQTDASWRAEGLAVLAWALGLCDLPAHDEPADVFTLWETLGDLDADRARALLAAPSLRPRDEIAALRDRLFALHWRLRDFTIRPQRMDFAGFARTAWFGPLDITGLPLAEGDLALRGVPIDQADPELLRAVTSAAQERHLAVNWLYEGPGRYSEADVST
jgi:Domain of unknown function (DUF4272)